MSEVPLFASLKKGLPISTTTTTVLFVSWVSRFNRRCLLKPMFGLVLHSVYHRQLFFILTTPLGFMAMADQLTVFLPLSHASYRDKHITATVTCICGFVVGLLTIYTICCIYHSDTLLNSMESANNYSMILITN